VRLSGSHHAFAAALLVALSAAPARAAEPGPEELYRRGAALYREGRYEEAARELAAAQALEPHAELAYDLGRAYERAGNVGGAIEAFREYLRLSPDAADRADVEAHVKELEASTAAPPVVSATPPVDVALRPPPARAVPAEAHPRLNAFQRIRVPTFVAFGAGTAALGAALGFLLAEQHEEDGVRSAATQLHARAAYGAAARDRDWARVLVGVGAAGILTGATLLTLDLTRKADHASGGAVPRTEIAVGPLGASVKGIF
jgi:tetratricopeptide (TPR) repeat protein